MRKVIIIDEYLVDKGGHHYEYNRAVQELLQQHGIETEIYGNIKLEPHVARELNAKPYFKGLPANFLNRIPLVGRLWNRATFSRTMYRKLVALYRAEIHTDAVFFYTTTVWYNVLPVALAASRSKQQSLLLFRYPISELVGMPAFLNKWGLRLYDFAFGKLIKSGKAIFFTDSNVIADECNHRYHCNMSVLPIPHVKEPIVSHTVEKMPPGNRFRLYAPGPVRVEKGIGLILDAAAKMSRERHPLLDQITLVIQANAGDQDLNTAVETRLKESHISYELLGNMSSEAYAQQLSQADIILIPYLVSHGYRARTSGVLSETIAACKPFITSKGSWMNAQSAAYHTGISIPDNDPNALIQALETITENYSTFRSEAEQAKLAWLAFHSTNNFYKILTEAVGGKS
ncbi:glycosyltransferase [Taibaiella koreensis]|uniref:glycosyltransferase n=1 Tax=Taibaiella koreensis TaxID=1268548 RepID=UPI000E59AE6E|nr:glycosyltransferase [Taibaiella koreensis]